MSGKATCLLTGRVTYVKDFPPTAGKPYGKISLRLELSPSTVDINNTNYNVMKHGVFVNVKYNSQDLSKAGLQQLMVRLNKDMFAFIQGDIKSMPATPKYPASLSIDTNWRGVRVSNEPILPINYVEMDGEVIAINNGVLGFKYTYRNVKDNTWKERLFNVVLSTRHSDLSLPPRSNIFIRGSVFGINPVNQSQLMWLYGNEIY